MKARERKWAQNELEKLSSNPEIRKLEEEFKRKGFLSRREMKVLESLSSKEAAA